VGATSYKSDQLINIPETGILLLLGVYHFFGVADAREKRTKTNYCVTTTPSLE